MEIEEIKRVLRKKVKKIETNRKYLSSGSTLLNLACSGSIRGCFVTGGYYFFVGDSASGKTFISLTCLAEATQTKDFNDYRFIYDNSEGGALMDIRRFFGKKVADKIEPPRFGKDGLPDFSGTIEEFYFGVDDALKDGRPFIYILDSMDSLSSKEEAAKFEETKKAHRKGKKIAGSYGDGKAKKNSANLRRLLKPLEKSNSILIIINQTRDNLGFGFEKKTRSGGHALRFYATVEIWSSVRKKITKTVRGKKRQQGIIANIQVKKNRLTGQEHSVLVPIYHSYGIDDMGSCVDYLIEEGQWKTKGKEGAKINASDFDFVGTREKLLQLIEKKHYEKDIKDLVNDVWTSIATAVKLKRKPRYE